MIKKGLASGIIILLVSTTMVSGINSDGEVQSSIALRQVSTIRGNHPPIYIEGNENFTSENGVTGGSGIKEDPYMIENWTIFDDGSTDNGIFITNTDAYFVIKNCSVYNYSELWHGRGILLSHVENGSIESTITYGNYYGIMIRDNSTHIEIINCSSGCSDDENSRGVICRKSSHITITSSEFHDITIGIFFEDTPYGIIENSSIYHCVPFGIWITGQETAHDYIIRDCRIYNNGYGIQFWMTKNFYNQPGNIYVFNCELYNNGRPEPNDSSSYFAIVIFHLHGNIIENCNIHHNGHGIGLSWSTDNIIRNCSIFNHQTNGSYGGTGLNIYNLALILLLKGWIIGNRIYNCDIYNNDVGLVANTGKTIIQKNNFF